MDNELNSKEIEQLIDLVKRQQSPEWVNSWDSIEGKLYKLLQERQMMEWNI